MSKATLLKMAKSKTAARKIASQVSSTELGLVIRNLESAKEFLDKKAERTRNAQKTQRIKKVMAMLDKMNLTAEDLPRSQKPTNKSKPNRQVPAKYRITVKGAVTEWSGRGRMPLVFRDALTKNPNLDRYLIKQKH